MWRLFTCLLVLSALIYYIFCFLEIFGFIKFTGKNTEITPGKALIPFYYIFKKEKKVADPTDLKSEDTEKN